MKTGVVALLLATSLSFAQKMKVASGDLKALKGVSEFNLVFDYEGLTVGKFKTEEDYINDKSGKKDDEEGEGANFRDTWIGDRQKRYEPKFIESFNKRFESGQVKADKGLASAKYTIRIKTTWISPGYNIHISRKPAAINVQLSIYESAHPSAVVALVTYEDVPGSGAFGMDYGAGYRISEAYAKLGKEFAGDLRKKIK